MRMNSGVLPGTLENVVEKESLRWIFVAGKGGVGKTTTSSSLSIALAKERESVLIVSTDPAHNVSDAFGQKFSKNPTKVRGVENLYAMEVEVSDGGALQLLQSDAGSLLSSTGLIPADGDPSQALGAINELVKLVPGVDEAIAFGVLMETIRSMNHSVIVFDTAPTGHTVRLLSFPSLLEKAVTKLTELNEKFKGVIGVLGSTAGIGSGDESLGVTIGRELTTLQSTVRAVVEEFKDPAKTTFVCVCIPEYLSIYETERLVQELSKFDVDTHNIVINQILDLDSGINEEALFAARSKIQMKYLAQIEELYGEDFHVTKVPILHEEVRGVGMIEKFGEILTGHKVTDFGVKKESEYDPSLLNVIEQQSLKWIFCGGKGGVGKTTTSCTLASEIAKDRLAKGLGRVLIVSTDPAHNLSDAFMQKISSGGVPTAVDGFQNLFALELDPESGAESITSSILPDWLAQNETVKEVAKSIPGIDEFIALAKIMSLVKSMEFSAVIFDTAPTGHTLKLLHFPELLQKSLVKVEDMKRRFDGILQTMTPTNDETRENAVQTLEELKHSLELVSKQMKDPELTTFVCVAIAEFLSVYETERLVQELLTCNIHVRNIVVNQLLDPNEENKTSLLRARAAMQRKYISQVEELYPTTEFHITQVPIRGEEVRGLALLESFSHILLGKKQN